MFQVLKVFSVFILSLQVTHLQAQNYFETIIDYNNYSETLNNVIYSDEGTFLCVVRSNTVTSNSFEGQVTLAELNYNGVILNNYPYSKPNSKYSFGTLINLPDTNGYIFFCNERLYNDTIGYTNSDYLAVRYNQDKSIRWAKRYGEANRYDLCYHGILTNDGGFVMVGQSSDSLQTTADNMLVKIDSEGNQAWLNYYGGSNFESALSVVQTPDSGYFVLGWTRSFGNGQRDFYLVKTDKQGNPQWQRTYGGSDMDSGWGITALSDGNYLLTGARIINGLDKAYLYKIDSAGIVIWQKNYTFENDESEFFWTKELPDKSIVAVGLSTNSSTNNAGYLVKIDSLGDILWQRKYNKNNETDLFYNVLPTTDGGFLLSGQCMNTTTFSQDAWLLKVDSVGCEYENCLVGIDEAGSRKVLVDVYPNPISEILNIELQETGKNYEIEIKNINGQAVFNSQITNHKSQVDVSGFANGIYLLTLQNSEQRTTLKIVIQH